MAKRALLVSVCFFTALGILFVLLSLLSSTNFITQDTAQAASLSTPSISLVSPDEAANNLDTYVGVTGMDFEAVLSDTVVITPPQLYLGETPLDTQWIDSSHVSGNVPWGMEPGVYTLTVVNPDGGTGWLANAFTVTQALNVWTSGGPYGGDVQDLAVSPVVSTTAYAAIRNAGLFRTTDSGGQWTQLIYNLGVSSVSFAPSGALFYMGEQVGLNRSLDGGDTWETLSQGGFTFAFYPLDEQRLWIGDYEGVQLSTDGGLTWDARSNGLPSDPETYPIRMAAHPTDPDIVLVGYIDGTLYRTEDSGLNWDLLEDGLPASEWGTSAHGLVFDPASPQVILYSRWQDNVAFGYRSVDGGDSWSAILDPQGCGRIYDPTFSPVASGTVYTPVNENRYAASSDHGATWTCYGEREGDFMISIGLDPASGLPAYLGGHSAGVWHSLDGAQTWENASHGLTGLPVLDIAASPTHPDTIYAAGEHGGAFRSDNAGASWQKLNLMEGQEIAAFAVGVDPIYPADGYVTSGGDIYRNPGNQGWLYSSVTITGAIALEVLEVSSISPSVIYAGGRNDDLVAPYHGVASRSSDYGETWTEIDFGGAVGYVTYIAVSPWDEQLVYVITGEAWPPSNPSAPDLLRSQDGGETWESIRQDIGDVRFASLAHDPQVPGVLYVGAYWTEAGYWTVFKSLDYGDTWEPTDIPLTWSIVYDLVIDPLEPDTLFAATGEGLFTSTNGGETWERVEGELSHAAIENLAISSAQGRTILYVSTQGGWIGSPRVSGYHPLADEFLQGGVYQLTLDHRVTILARFIPLVTK